jgi:hypothetical protein
MSSFSKGSKMTSFKSDWTNIIRICFLRAIL